jgi:hypothetical protein
MTKKIIDRELIKAGRKLKEPPKDCVALIEQLAADGWSVLGIAKRLGTSADTFRRWLDEDDQLQEALNSGRENERWQLHNMLFKQATEKGNPTAAMFLLKARHGYREGDQSETSNRVTINFALPGAISMDEFSKLTKVIEHGSSNDTVKPVPTKSLVRT